MRDWENKYPNPVLKSREIVLLLERILNLRRLVEKDLLLERNYQNLKVENAISHYKIIITGFLIMGFFSIFIPLLMLLLPPIDHEDLIAWSSFVGFLLSSLLTMKVLMKSAMK